MLIFHSEVRANLTKSNADFSMLKMLIALKKFHTKWATSDKWCTADVEKTQPPYPARLTRLDGGFEFPIKHLQIKTLPHPSVVIG